MSDHDSFEERLRAMAEQLTQRMTEVDFDDVAERYGLDPERARGFANAAGQWLNGLSGGGPLFGDAGRRDSSGHGPGADLDAQTASRPPGETGARSTQPGPHPLDLPTGAQGLALSALDSGRWTVRPGSNRLAGSGEGPLPPDSPDAPELVGELRGRDWITADGTLTLTGRHALTRWCRAAEDPPADRPAPSEPA